MYIDMYTYNIHIHTYIHTYIDICIHIGIYMEPQVSLAQSCLVGVDSVLGGGSVVADRAQVKSSILGRNCRVAQDAVVENSFLLDNVSVGAGAVVRAALKHMRRCVHECVNM